MAENELRRIQALLKRDEVTLKKEEGYTVYDLNYRSTEVLPKNKHKIVIIPVPYHLTDLTFEPKDGFADAHTISFDSDENNFKEKLEEVVSEHIESLEKSEEWKRFWELPNKIETANNAWDNFLQNYEIEIDVEKNEIANLARETFIIRGKELLLDRVKMYNSNINLLESNEIKYRRLGAISEIENLITFLKTIRP